MNKDIEKIQKSLKEAIFDQERKKVRYDAHVVIAEGHRRQISDIVEDNQKMMHELMDSGRVVDEWNKQLQKALEDEAAKNETEKTEE